MPKRKTKSNKRFIRPVHIHTLLFTFGYAFLSRFIFIKAVTNRNIFTSFLVPYIFGLIACVVLLYLFNHEDFFHFMKDVEKKEKKRENKYLKKYYHHGKILASILIGTIGGSFFLALTIRFLLNKFAYKYLIMVIAVFLSTLLSVGLAKGLLSFLI